MKISFDLQHVLPLTCLLGVPWHQVYFPHHMLKTACDHKSRAHTRAQMQEEIELIMGKALLAVFCLATFNSEEEWLEISSLFFRFGQSSYFSIQLLKGISSFSASLCNIFVGAKPSVLANRAGPTGEVQAKHLSLWWLWVRKKSPYTDITWTGNWVSGMQPFSPSCSPPYLPSSSLIVGGLQPWCSSASLQLQSMRKPEQVVPSCRRYSWYDNSVRWGISLETVEIAHLHLERWVAVQLLELGESFLKVAWSRRKVTRVVRGIESLY